MAAKVANALQVFALDDEAAQLGLCVGQPLATARAVCPSIEVVDADEAADRATLEDIADWCDRFTPLIGIDPPHGLSLDITGCAHLFGGEAELMQKICSILIAQGFAVSAAIAANSVCGRTLTRHRHGVIVRGGEEAMAVSDLPIATLEADAKIVQGLRRAGLKTIGAVAARSRKEIAIRFGAAFMVVLEQALGEGDAPISPRRPVPDYVAEKRFAEPVATTGIIMPTLTTLARHLVGAMEPHGKGARQLMASFFRTDGMVRTIAVETGHPVTAVATVERLFAEKLDTLSDPLDPGFGFDLIRLAAIRTVGVTPMQSGFDTHDDDAEDVAALSDRLAARLGPRQIIRYLPANTHIPEHADCAIPALQMQPGFVSETWPLHLADEPPRRPLRLFTRPEEIEVLFAEIPDKPPQRFNWRRVTHLVVRAEGPERIAMEWWHLHPTGPTRDYFRIENQDGMRFWLFRNGMYGELADAEGKPVNPRWFLHGLFA